MPIAYRTGQNPTYSHSFLLALLPTSDLCGSEVKIRSLINCYDANIFACLERPRI